MVFEFKLPDIGEGVHEGEIVKWLVSEGDTVEEDQPIVEVMTDKATVELTAPRAGTIASIKAEEGDVIDVGTIFVTIDEDGGGGGNGAATKTEKKKAPAKEKAEPEEKEEKTLFEGQEQVDLVKRKKKKTAAKTPSDGGSRGGPVEHPAGKPIAAPAVRRRAREMDIELKNVKGSGPMGRIVHDDLESFLERREGPTPETAPPAATTRTAPRPITEPKTAGWTSPDYEPGQTIPFRGLRRKISEAMRASKDKASHFTYVEEVDATELVALRSSAKPLADQRGIPLTFLPFIVKAVVAGLKAHPLVNSRLNEDEGVVELLDEYHVGIAVATDQGLIVPVVKDADRKSVFQIAQEMGELSEKTRQGKASRDELTGSTFTITSLGKIGGLLATPIINQPEVAIMGVHAIKDKPVVKDGEVVPGKVMNLSFTFDHGIVDGAYGAEFAQTVIRFLEDPKLLLLETA